MWEFVQLHWNHAVEILLLAVLLYQGYRFLRATRGARILTGLLVLLLGLALVSQLLKLEVITWLLKGFVTFFAIALVVIFQPEIRRALDSVGRVGSFGWMLSPADSRAVDHVADEVARAAAELSAEGHGAGRPGSCRRAAR
jgi:diadenylate cyclase